MRNALNADDPFSVVSVIVVIRRIVVNFTTRLSVGKTEEVKGVTKLRNEVYALCRSISPSSPNVIRVFEDRNLFRLQKEIDLKDIKDPEDIGSSERENVLYVTDLGMKCVWKITREADDYPAIRKWSNSDLRWQYTLSVTNDGQLLMLSGGNPVSCLGIYGSDGELRHSIQLPTEIRNFGHPCTQCKHLPRISSSPTDGGRKARRGTRLRKRTRETKTYGVWVKWVETDSWSSVVWFQKVKHNSSTILATSRWIQATGYLWQTLWTTESFFWIPIYAGIEFFVPRETKERSSFGRGDCSMTKRRTSWLSEA